jgi:hypothetical protein
MRKRLNLPIAAVFAVMLLGGPSSSVALGEAVSDEAGWPCTATSSKAGWTLLASPQTGWSVSPLVKQSRAVITSWNVRVGPGLSPLAQQLNVFRAVTGGPEYTKVAESAVETFGAGSEALPTRIPVQAGDFVGLHGPLATFVCNGPEEGATSALFEGAIALGETKAFKTESGVRSPVSSTVELDADGDGYGDASQDHCPESAATQIYCPEVTLRATASAKKNSIWVRVTTSSEASVRVFGQVAWHAVPKPGHARSSTRAIPLIVGLAGGTQIVMPKKVAQFEVTLPKSVKRRLGRLSPAKSLKASLTASATDLAGRVVTKALAVRLRGQKRPG